VVADLLKMVDVEKVDVVVRLEGVVKFQSGPATARKLVKGLEDGRLGATGDEEVERGYEVTVDIGEYPDNGLLCRNAVDFVQAVEKNNVGPLRAFSGADRVEGFDDQLERLDIHCLGDQAFVIFERFVYKWAKVWNSFDHLGNKRRDHKRSIVPPRRAPEAKEASDK